jgi:AbiV family abortive infection protein
MPLDRGPKSASLLYRNLFDRRDCEHSIRIIAEGISSVLANAKRLLANAELMQDTGHLSTARFLITTAREEIAKTYILVDMCRLDFGRHESVLRKLCQAFYDHIAKHAYVEVLTFTNVTSMKDAQSLWETAVKRWWPGCYEDGEPDMQHETYFDREMPLYVDFGDYDQKWLLPTDSDQNAHFEPCLGRTPMSDAHDLLDPWEKASSLRLCTPETLTAVNRVFAQCYVKETTDVNVLVALYKRVAQALESDLVVRFDDFEESPLHQWPLYHFVSEGY